MDKQELVRIMTGLFEGNHGAAQIYAENNQLLLVAFWRHILKNYE